jgi:hypothetical protein
MYESLHEDDYLYMYIYVYPHIYHNNVNINEWKMCLYI